MGAETKKVAYHAVLRAYEAAAHRTETQQDMFAWYERMQTDGVERTPEMERVAVMTALQAGDMKVSP